VVFLGLLVGDDGLAELIELGRVAIRRSPRMLSKSLATGAGNR
jgi:hypothetical protein